MSHNPRELMNYWAKHQLVQATRPDYAHQYTESTVARRTEQVLCVHSMTATALVSGRIRYKCDLCRLTIVVNKDGEIIC